MQIVRAKMSHPMSFVLYTIEVLTLISGKEISCTRADSIMSTNFLVCDTFALAHILSIDIFSSSTTWDRSTTNPKFDSTGVRTHDLQIMTLHVTETPSLTTRPSVTSKNPCFILSHRVWNSQSSNLA